MRLRNMLNSIVSTYKNNKLTIWMLIGVAVGIIIAIIMRVTREEPYSSREAMYFGFLGEIFLRMLKGVALPLVITCLIHAFGTLDKSVSWRLGALFTIYCVVTKFEVIILSIVLALIIQPGYVERDHHVEGEETITKNLTISDNFLDIVRNIFPANLVEMTMKQYETKLTPPIENESGTLPPMSEWDIGGTTISSTNMLGVVTTSIFFGIAIGLLKKEEGERLLDVILSVCRSTFIIIKWVMYLSPICMVSLVGSQVLDMKNMVVLLKNVGLYVVTYFLALTIQCFLVYPLILFVFTHSLPFKLYRIYLNAMLTALATMSSLTTIPVAIKAFEDVGEYDSRLVRFIIPVGITTSKDGAASMFGVAPVCIAQLNNIYLSFGQYMSIVILGVTTSVAAAGVPFGSIVILVMILSGLNLPAHDIGMLMAVDWFTDRYNTLATCLGPAFILEILHLRNFKLQQGTVEEGQADGESLAPESDERTKY